MAHPRLTDGDKTYREDPAILLHLLFDTPHRLVAVDLLARQIPIEEAQAVWTAWSAFLTANDLDLTLTGHIATTAMAILRADIVTPHDKTEMVTYLQSLVQSGVSEDTLRAHTAPPSPGHLRLTEAGLRRRRRVG
jgi:ABC-type molybdate transport system ATPase subunit